MPATSTNSSHFATKCFHSFMAPPAPTAAKSKRVNSLQALLEGVLDTPILGSLSRTGLGRVQDPVFMPDIQDRKVSPRALFPTTTTVQVASLSAPRSPQSSPRSPSPHTTLLITLVIVS